MQQAFTLLSGDVLTVKADLTGGGSFQQVDAAQQGGLAGAGGADDAGHVAGGDGKVDVLQNLMGAEGLGQVAASSRIVSTHLSSLSLPGSDSPLRSSKGVPLLG